jgi:Ca2+/H+ antiporter, TMEM165/GDT1 family
MINWVHAMPAISAAFLGSFVELVEAFTIILAAASVRGWRPALLGTAAGLGVLVVLVVTLGPMFTLIPLQLLQIVVGVMLLLFGMRWLRKAILRGAGFIALHDEDKAFTKETDALRAEARVHAQGADFIAGLAAFKGVVLEGVEVVFIVIAVGTGNGLLIPASLGALAACILVLLIGMVVHKPLSKVPENTLKLIVGVMLSAFGTFWTGEGLGVAWPGADFAILAFAAGFLALALAATSWLRQRDLRGKVST